MKTRRWIPFLLFAFVGIDGWAQAQERWDTRARQEFFVSNYRVRDWLFGSRTGVSYLTRRLQFALNEAVTKIGEIDHGIRGGLVEQELRDGLGSSMGRVGAVFNVKIGLREGEHVVIEINGERARVEGAQVVAEADVVQVKPGRTLRLGEKLVPEDISNVWEIKSSATPMRSHQRRLYRTVFGRNPIEMHPKGFHWRNMYGQTIQAAHFGGGYLFKEALNAMEARDGTRLKGAAKQLTSVGFWGSFAVFTSAAKVAEWGVGLLPSRPWGWPRGAKGLTRMVLPLAVGMTAVELLSGRFSPRDILISTLAFTVAGTGVNLLADSLVYPGLFAAGPPGWMGAAIYSIGKIGLSLYAGEKLESWIRSLLGRRSKERFGEGVRGRIEDVERVRE